jgi:N-acetylmuramoyl-L-alanine amidase/Bacterial Ig domain
MSSLRISLLALVLACGAGALARDAGAAAPPITWLKGEGNYTKSHRAAHSIDRIVVHVTEGSFWGSVQWLQSPRAHASSHFVISRAGRIVQLVHVSDIAWHAGNWRTNVESVGIEHEGFTYGPHGFTNAQYRSSARLTAWLARRSLMPIDRRHIIGHHEVPGPNGGAGGADGHTDPGPRWNWKRYLRLVRTYARGPLPPLEIVASSIGRGALVTGKRPWRVRTSKAVRRVEFVVGGRVLWIDRKPPFAFGRGHGLNSLLLPNGRHAVEVRAFAGSRQAVRRFTIVVRNRRFTVTTAGAREWTRTRGVVRLRSRVWGAKAQRVVFRLDGRRRLVDRTAPFALRWDTRRGRDGKHVLEVVAYAVDGRVARRRIPVVVSNTPAPAKPKPPPKPKPAPPKLRIVSQSVTDGQTVDGLVIWHVEATGAARVEFVIDGVSRGADVAAPFTYGWDTAAEQPGAHELTARAVGSDGKTVGATVTVTVPERPANGGSGAP